MPSAEDRNFLPGSKNDSCCLCRLSACAKLRRCKCPHTFLHCHLQLSPLKKKLAIFQTGTRPFGDPIFKQDLHLPFKFRQYPKTDLANGFQKMKWQHLLGISNCSRICIFFSAQQNRKKVENIWTQVEHTMYFQLELALPSYLQCVLKLILVKRLDLREEIFLLSGTKSTFVASH